MVPPGKDVDFEQSGWVEASPGKADITFHMIDLLP